MPHPLAIYMMLVNSVIAALWIAGDGWMLLIALKWFAMAWVTTMIWALVCPGPLIDAPIMEDMA